MHQESSEESIFHLPFFQVTRKNIERYGKGISGNFSPLEAGFPSSKFLPLYNSRLNSVIFVVPKMIFPWQQLKYVYGHTGIIVDLNIFS